MKKNGFTLVELLAVIVILSILIAITTVSVNNIRKKQEVQNRENVISSILTGAKNYMAEHTTELANGATIKVSKLLEGNYVDFDQNKYSDLKDKSVSISACANTLKLKYSVDNYNDCGCEAQSDNTISSKICNN